MDDEVRDRIMPGCLIGTAAASCFFDLVDGERGSRRYQYNSKQNEFGYFYDFSPLEREIYNLTGLETKREYRFHPTREWRFDFAIPAVRVAIEVEGGVWNGGRHFRPEGYLRDMEKYNEAAACGWLVIRTIPSELLRVKTCG